MFVDEEKFLRDFLRRRAGWSNLDPNREFHLRLRDGHDVLRHRSRKKHCLSFTGKCCQYPVELRSKTHIEHPISLIKNEGGD